LLFLGLPGTQPLPEGKQHYVCVFTGGNDIARVHTSTEWFN